MRIRDNSTNDKRILVRRSVPFTIVANAVLKDKSLKAADKSVYATLCMYADNRTAEAWPSRSTLMDMAGVSDKTLRNSLDRLEERGYISIKMRRGLDGSQLSNLYVLLDPVGKNT